MVGIRELNPEVEVKMVCMTKGLYDAGYTPEFIARELKQPLIRVKQWIKWIELFEETKDI